MSVAVSGENDARAKHYAAVFSTPAGQEVLADLRRLTIERQSDPAISEAELRHLEGQRYLVRTIEHLIKRGKS